MRSGDFTARYGGEEFVVLMSNTDLAGAAILAGRIRAAIRDAEFTVDGKTIQLTCSIGGSSMIPSGHDSKSLIKTADALLYRAKESGRDRALLDTPAGATGSSGTSAA
jgi:diguanylate cyclase (GGDEF)-like protein